MRLLIFTFFLLLSFQILAKKSDFFVYDKSKIVSTLKDLDTLQNILETTIPLLPDYSMLIGNCNLSPQEKCCVEKAINKLIKTTTESFMYGCCFGPLGMLYATFDQQDKLFLLPAYMGCTLHTLALFVIFITYIGL